MWKRYLNPDHLTLLDNRLMECARHAQTHGMVGIDHLIVEMPPRHGKTTTISRFFPTWYLGNNPDDRVILASYGATLAQKNSRYARNILMLPRYHAIFEDVQLAYDSKAADAWNIEGHEGGLDAVGVGAGVTGKGGNIIVVDDPVKSREEAESPTYRNKVWDWFTDDLYTRREPGAAVIVVMTRWHQDDLVGRLLREQPTQWTRLRMPALAEDYDPLHRSIGAALWNDRYPLSELRHIEDVLGGYSFSALYQQNPVPAEGGLFKRAWFTPVDGWPEIRFAVRFWDLAMSEKTSADYTVGVKMGLGSDGHSYVLDVVRRQLDWGQVTPFIADIILHDGPDVVQGLEEKGYMSRAVQDLNADSRLHGYAIYGYPVDTDKLTRALPVAAKFAAGVLHIVLAGWNRDYVDELCSFPQGTHDDQVDATSGAWAMLGGPLATEGAINYAPDSGIGSGIY